MAGMTVMGVVTIVLVGFFFFCGVLVIGIMVVCGLIQKNRRDNIVTPEYTIDEDGHLVTVKPAEVEQGKEKERIATPLPDGDAVRYLKAGIVSKVVPLQSVSTRVSQER